MNYGKKMVLTPAQTEQVIEKKQSELDIEMSKILNRNDLDDSDKIRLYNQILTRFLNFNKKDVIENVDNKDVSTETDLKTVPKYELDTPVLGVKERDFLNSFNINHPSAKSVLQTPKTENTTPLNENQISFLNQLSVKKPIINNRVLETFLVNEPAASSQISPIRIGSSPLRHVRKKIKNGETIQLSPQMRLRNIKKQINYDAESDLDKTPQNWQKYD